MRKILLKELEVHIAPDDLNTMTAEEAYGEGYNAGRQYKNLEKLSPYKKYSYGIDNIKDKTQGHNDIIGHTWLTHVKRKGSALTEIGKVIWHSLNESGEIIYYDILWENGEIERNIHVSELKSTCKDSNHAHEERKENTSVSERVDKLTRGMIRKLILEEIKSIYKK